MWAGGVGLEGYRRDVGRWGPGRGLVPSKPCSLCSHIAISLPPSPTPTLLGPLGGSGASPESLGDPFWGPEESLSDKIWLPRSRLRTKVAEFEVAFGFYLLSLSSSSRSKG